MHEDARSAKRGGSDLDRVVLHDQPHGFPIAGQILGSTIRNSFHVHHLRQAAAIVMR